MNFPTITTLNEVLINTPLTLEQGEWGLVMLDLDHTLIQAKTILGDEHFYKFLVKHNKESKINADIHYNWVAKIREQIPYETCELTDRVNHFIQVFRANNWTVKILTSRGLDMKESTLAHLAQAKIDLSIDDVIFKKAENNKWPDKDDSSIAWMKEQKQWHEAKKIRMVFLDDNEKYCKHVARVGEKVCHASVTCFNYLGAEPKDELRPDQLKALVVQLHAYSNNRAIPYQHDEADVQAAQAALSIPEITAKAVYEKVMEFVMSFNK